MSKPLILELKEAIEELKEKTTWKTKTVNLAINEYVTIPELKDAKEVYIQGTYNADTANHGEMIVLNDGTRGYHQILSHYWQGAYPVSALINWQLGSVMNCSDKANIVLIAYR